MASRPELIEFRSRVGMADRLADLIQLAIAGPIRHEGLANIALSGGSTPALLYQRLAQTNQSDWSKTQIGLVDERWVAPGEEGSNEAFIRDVLDIEKNPPGEFSGLWSNAADPKAGAFAASEKYHELKHLLDVVVLGMGADGHTASWFPQAEGLESALSMDREEIVHVRAKASKVTGPYLDRLTLTLGAVAHARLIVLLLHGDSKRNTFLEACKPGPVEDMPVRAILNVRSNIWVCWAP